MSKPNLTGIRNIIFDFGRVLLNINPLLTQTALLNLGFRPDSNNKGAKDDEIVQQLESGRISGKEFVDTVLAVTAEGTTAEQVISAWNAMLLDFPEHHLNTLKELKKKYRIFLLSNSNEIHFESYATDFRNKYGFELSDVFDKMWFSYQIGIIKPEPEIFRFVLKDAGLDPSETLFIDDTLVHVEAARSVGINAYHLAGDEDISDLF